MYSTSTAKLEADLLRGVPFAYLLGFSEFYGLRFTIDSRVLVPRPETELLVDRMMEIRRRRGKPFQHVLDVGTGSGVILLSLMANRFALEGTGSDLSSKALTVAATNARQLRLSVNFRQSDRLASFKETFDVIVSNPPYIKEAAHFSGVHESVHQHEPHMALYLKDSDYDVWFRDFFQSVYHHLEPSGLFFMEGHEETLSGQAVLLRELGFQDVQVLQDLSGRPRYLEAKRG